jgi:D-beta-D-heptose 7-phosphate kinase/D-beta-D-heptose 1-phosphate adenosyltransferase
MKKIKKISQLQKEIVQLRKQGRTIVFTNGCFDILHPGHIKILRQAKQKGDVLIVGLNSDLSVKKIKGPQRPILDERARALVLSALAAVDYVITFHEPTPYQLIQKIKPDILVKGDDWDSSNIVGSNLVKKVCRVKLYPGYSTTDIIKKIKNTPD